MGKKYSQVRDIKNGRSQVNGFYHSAMDYFSEEFNIPRGSFPKLKFVSGERTAYNQVDNIILVGDEEFISDIGNTIGEELGHYVRAKLKGRVGKEVEKKEAHSDEFYGFLGSKELYLKSNEMQKEEFFKHGERTFESDSEGKTYPELRREILDQAKEKGFLKLRKRYNEAEKSADEGEMKKIYEEAKEKGYKEHVSHLLHVRPYHFASDTNLNNIDDMRKLYSLSDESLRKRFFREDKIYDTSEDKKERNKIKKGLEGKISILIFSSLILIFFFLKKEITGNIIGTREGLFNPLFLILILITFFSAGLIIHKLITHK